MQHLLKEVDKMLQLNVDERPLICGVGFGGYWAERFRFHIRQYLQPNCSFMRTCSVTICLEDMPSYFACVTNFRGEERDRCLRFTAR